MPACKLKLGRNDQCENFNGSYYDLDQESKDKCKQQHPNCGPIIDPVALAAAGREINAAFASLRRGPTWSVAPAVAPAVAPGAVANNNNPKNPEASKNQTKNDPKNQKGGRKQRRKTKKSKRTRSRTTRKH